MPFEWHESLEIFYTLSGKGQYFIEDKMYTFEAGDLFVISNDELHKSQLIDGESFAAWIVMFNPRLLNVKNLDDEFQPLSLFYNRPAGFSHQLKTEGKVREKIATIFRYMQEEYERPEGYSLTAMVGLLQWLLVELERAYLARQPYNEMKALSGMHLKEIVVNVLNYIDDHYCEDIKLSQIARELCVSPSYLSREFKRSTGFSLVEFIASKRIRRARDLLQRTNLQVTEIATEVGYNNVTHFHWTFKKMVGVSPGQYRKMAMAYEQHG